MWIIWLCYTQPFVPYKANQGGSIVRQWVRLPPYKKPACHNHVLAVPILTQFLDDDLRKAAEEGPSVWTSATYVEDPHEVLAPDLCLTRPWPIWSSVEWTSKWTILFPSLFPSFCVTPTYKIYKIFFKNHTGRKPESFEQRKRLKYFIWSLKFWTLVLIFLPPKTSTQQAVVASQATGTSMRQLSVSSAGLRLLLIWRQPTMCRAQEPSSPISISCITKPGW